MKTRNVFPILVAAVLAACTSSSNDSATANNSAIIESALRKGSVDHGAIVEGATMMLGTPTDSLLDQYNQEDDPFSIHANAFSPQFARVLAQFDAYDSVQDWPNDQAAAWVARMAGGNYLVVDTSKPCDFNDPHTYLEIERSALTGTDHQTCGGRMPNEDALDVTLNFMVRGPGASATDSAALHDGVEQATTQSQAVFPYLAELNGI
jgi:hypothetical protein